MWLHAMDTAQAVVTIVDCEVKNEVYNVGGNCELSNIEVVEKIHSLMVSPMGQGSNWKDAVCDFSFHREGQDVRYSLNDNKLRMGGWYPRCEFDKELPAIVEYYRNHFIW